MKSIICAAIVVLGAVSPAAAQSSAAADVTVVDPRDTVIPKTADSSPQNWWRSGTTWAQALLQCAGYTKHFSPDGTPETRSAATQSYMLAALNRMAKDRHLDRSELFPSLRASMDTTLKEQGEPLSLIVGSERRCDGLLKANNAS